MVRPATFVVSIVRVDALVVLMMFASYTETLPVPQSGSVTRSYWYQTTETEPAFPACTHGHSTVVPGCVTVSGFDQVTPWSVDQASWTEFARVVSSRPQPPLVPL